jgi:putative Ca2+/H+ antiporter (TMEM165/GDT1 family)
VSAAGLPSVRAAVTGSFGVIVLAEWGDLTQFATAGMAASTGEPLMVAVGALLALWAVAGLAATVGRQVAARLPIHLIQRAAAGVFAVLALSVLWSLRA